MGNCLVYEEKVVQVMKSTDGRIYKYKAPIRVHQVLSDFSGHVLSESLTGICHLQQHVKLLCGNLYYLVPSPPKEEEEGTGIVRIKLIISKTELQELLQKGGVSIKDMVSQIKGTKHVDDNFASDNCKGWRPQLESIPELD